LIDLFNSTSVGQSIVFVNSKNKAKFVHEQLSNNGFCVEVMHSDLTQNERSDVLAKVRSGACRCLVATGLVARGIDIQQLSVVFNFELPKITEKSTYIHRIGRAGRYGRKGKAINLIYHNELSDIKEIQEFYATVINPLPSQLDLK